MKTALVLGLVTLFLSVPDHTDAGHQGVGGATLELKGTVWQQAFEAVLAGTLPGGDTIAAGANGKHRAGLDFTFSAPKSLSLLAYVGGDVRLLEAHMVAVRTTIGWMEANLAETRGSCDGRQCDQGIWRALHNDALW